MVDVILGGRPIGEGVNEKANGSYFSRDYNESLTQRMNTAATVIYQSGHVVKELGFWQRAEPTGPVSITVSIYNITEGVPSSIPIYSKDISSDVGTGVELYITLTGINDSLASLSGGETLAIAVDTVGSGMIWPGRRVDVSTSLSPPSSTPNNPWSQSGTSGTESPDVYFVLGEAGPQLSVTDPINPGATTTISSSGNVDPWTGARITDSAGNVKEITLSSQTSVSAPAVGNLDYVLYGDVTLEVYNATESATTTVAFNQPSGFDLISLESGFVTTQESYLFNYGGTPSVGDQFSYNPIANDTGETLTLGSDGLWTSSGFGTWTIYGTDATDGEMQSFQFVWDESQSENVVSALVRKINSRKLNTRSIKARGVIRNG